ncbi:MAG: hypothetical protein LBT26_05350, partial [Clostridiales Family XIII bacterium]|nr:hypothetical protein [Clostridiales Family XIII bacterium]
MVKNSINGKISRTMLLLCLFSLLLSGAIAMVMLLNIRDLAIEHSGEIGQTAAENSESLVLDMTLFTMERQVESNGYFIDGGLRTMVNSVNILCLYIEDLYRNPDAFKPRPFAYYKDVAEGSTEMHWFLEPGLIPAHSLGAGDL